MKKIILSFILALLTLGVETVSALSYNGTNVFQLPAIGRGGTVYYNLSSGGGGENINLQITTDLKMQSFTNIFRFQSGSQSYSGNIASYSAVYDYSCGGWSCSGDTAYLILDLIPQGPNDNLLVYKIYTNNLAGSAYHEVESGEIMHLSDMSSCPGLLSDCLMVVQPRFYYRTPFIGAGTYIPYIDFIFFYDENREGTFHRQYFGSLTADGPSPSAWQSFVGFFGGNSGEYGLQMTTSTNGSMNFAGCSGTGISCYSLTRSASGSNYDDTILRDFFIGNSGSTLLDAYFPDWIGANGDIASTSSNVNISGGGTGSSSIFSPITNALTGSGGLVDQIKNIPGQLVSYFLPDINFNGMSDSCATGVGSSSGYPAGDITIDMSSTNSYEIAVGSTVYFSNCTSDSVDVYEAGDNFFGNYACGGSFKTYSLGTMTLYNSGSSIPIDLLVSPVASSGDSIVSSSGVTSGIVQKFANLFIILMPTAPVDGSSVCMIDGTVETIHYDGRTNVFDLMLVLSVFFTAFITLKPKHD